MYLVLEKRRVIREPCLLSLRLAMSKTGIYEKSSLRRSWEVFQVVNHLISEVCFKREMQYVMLQGNFTITSMAPMLCMIQINWCVVYSNNARGWKHLGGTEFETSYNLHGLICSHSKSQEDRLSLGLNLLEPDEIKKWRWCIQIYRWCNIG